MVDKRIAIRFIAEGGRAVRAEFTGVGDAGEDAFNDLARAQSRAGQVSGQFRGQVQNAAFQIQDFAVQVGAGTSATQALAQQLPQLLGGFGLLGAAIGAAVAIGLPLGRLLLDSGDASEELAKSLEQVRSPFDGLEGAYNALGSAQSGYIKAVEAGNVDLAESYRILIEQQKESIAQESKRTEAALQGNREALRAAQDAVAEAQAAVDSFNAIASRRTDISSGFSVIDTSSYAEATAYLSQMTANADELGIAVDIAETQIRILAEESASAAGSVQSGAEAANGLASGLSAAAGSAAALAQNMKISLQAASAPLSMGGGPSSVMFDPRDPNYDPVAAELARLAESPSRVSPFDASRLP